MLHGIVILIMWHGSNLSFDSTFLFFFFFSAICRTAKVLDDMAAAIQDPLIMVHWSVLQQPLQATVKVFISSPGYEHFAR